MKKYYVGLATSIKIILLLFHIALTLYQVSIFGFSVALIFFIVLTIGFVLEIGTGAIKI